MKAELAKRPNPALLSLGAELNAGPEGWSDGITTRSPLCGLATAAIQAQPWQMVCATCDIGTANSVLW